MRAVLSYRHHFHAGNFSDVFKHAVLSRLLLAATRKDTPLRYLETHAGAGVYDLSHPWAQKNREYETGIARVLWRPDVPPELARYLDAVRAENPGSGLHRYPGSPRLAQRLLRPCDRLSLFDLNRAEAESLQQIFAGDRRVRVERRDGYEALKACLPPPERRAVVLVDSSFDRAGEFARLAQALAQAHRRFATGAFALWYPLMDSASMRAFEEDVRATGLRRILQAELEVEDEAGATALRGCGMLLVRPPWRLDEELRGMVAWLEGALRRGRGASRVGWLVPE